jgi:hypothetical protein
MPPADPRIDAYIAAQADFARPILEHIRRLVHDAAPEAEETIKWGMPHFTVGGRIMGGMAGFKAHATLGLWQANEVLGQTGTEREAMGQFGRIASIADLPGEDEKRAEAGRRDAGGPGGGACRKHGRAGDLRCFSAELPARIYPVGGGGEAAGDPGEPGGAGRVLDGGGETPELEV